jgi:Cyclic nucleotide-binding domain/Major Facilitator Superfamily
VSAVRAVTIGGAAALLAVDAHHAFVYALVVVATAAFTVFRPAHSSLLPLLCTTTTELTSANVVRGLLEALATLVGPVVAGALLAWSSPTAVFAAAALLSLGAMGLLLRIRYDAPELPIVEQPQLFQEAVEGVRSVARQRDLRLIFALGSTQAYVRGALTVFTVVLALDLLDLGESGVAALSAFIGVGGLVGSLGVSLLVGSRHLGGWLVVALVLWGTPIAVIGLAPGAALAYAMVAVVGLANALIDVPLYTLPVRLVRDEVLTRAFGVFESTITIAVALGSALTPVLIALLDLEGAMIATGLLLPLVGLLAWRRLATLDEHLSVRDVEISVIRSASMLQLLPVPSIEYLATEAVTRTVPAGTDLCRQGEPGDSFFVIAEGHADVIGDGSPVRTVGPGECFGEIALLHDVARTATVRAREDLTVLEIDGDAFVDVVARHSTTNAAALAVVDTHLADFRPARAGA